MRSAALAKPHALEEPPVSETTDEIRVLRSRWWGRAGIVVVLGALVGVAVVTAFRFSSALQEIRFSTVTLAGLSGLLTLLLAVVIVVGAAWARAFGTRYAVWWALAAMIPLVLVIQYAFPTITGLVAPDDPGRGRRVTILAQNMFWESSRTEDQIDELLQQHADVYVLSEFTPKALEALRQHGLDRRFPYTVLRPDPGRLGMAVLSRFPLLVRSAGTYRIEVNLVPPGAAPLHVIAAHTPAPTRAGIHGWQSDLDALARVAKQAGPNTVVAGDLNATSGHVAFREMASRAELTDAQDAAGGGFAGTWNLMSRLPPLLRFDHVLVGSGVGVDDFRFAPRIGSDHQGVIATIVARSATST